MIFYLILQNPCLAGREQCAGSLGNEAGLFGEEDVTAENVERITEKLRASVRKGYYYRVLRDVARVEMGAAT